MFPLGSVVIFGTLQIPNPYPQRNSQAVKIKMSQSIRDQAAHLGHQIAPQINNTSLKLLEKHFWHVW
jgi:hypothetical protein